VGNSRIARELEVLHLIAERLSRADSKHMYGRLEINSRTQAVVRLRESNLR